jgi:hypothetical protein
MTTLSKLPSFKNLDAEEQQLAAAIAAIQEGADSMMFEAFKEVFNAPPAVRQRLSVHENYFEVHRDYSRKINKSFEAEVSIEVQVYHDAHGPLMEWVLCASRHQTAAGVRIADSSLGPLAVYADVGPQQTTSADADECASVAGRLASETVRERAFELVRTVGLVTV